mgnify:CR=1 FL=1
MLGQSSATALDVKAGKACRTACLRKRIVGSFTSKNSKNESLPSHREFISVYVYPFFTFLLFYLFTFLLFYLFTFLPFYLFTFLPFYLFTFSYNPLAFSNPLASGDFIPVKSVNISIWSLVLPRLSTFSRNALPTAGSSAPCLAK